jgi:glycosyltransferase involved in cell wall biosynthesis
MNLSVVLATFNEEKNIAACIESVRDIASEIVIVDGTSKDATVSIAKKYGAKVVVTENHPIFHINKQKALELAQNTWILQLDADERVSKALAKEIKEIISKTNLEIEEYQNSLPKRKLFLRHQKLLEERDGEIGIMKGEYVAFFIPRKNYFLGRFLKYGGVYPDGVIRLVKNGKARFPAKDVHEQIEVNGKVGWLENDLFHMDSPTFSKYLMRWQRYTDLLATQIKDTHKKFDLITAIKYLVLYPIHWFLLTFFRHKGILDSWQGFVFSFFSALRFPTGYIKYLKKL